MFEQGLISAQVSDFKRRTRNLFRIKIVKQKVFPSFLYARPTSAIKTSDFGQFLPYLPPSGSLRYQPKIDTTLPSHVLFRLSIYLAATSQVRRRIIRPNLVTLRLAGSSRPTVVHLMTRPSCTRSR
jgi:hypothetical protein